MRTITPAQPDSQLFCFTVKTDGERCDVEVTSRIIATNANPLRDRVRNAIDDGHKFVRIDLGQCDEVAPIGFSILLSLAQRANKKGGRVTIANASIDLVELFVYHHIDGQFAFDPPRAAQ